MKKLYIPFAIFTIIGLFIYSACKNPISEISNFKLGINGELGKSVHQVKIMSSDSTYALDIANTVVYLSGKDAHMIYDKNGERSFPINADGTVDMVLSPQANPTDANPLVFKFNVSSPDHLPSNQELFFFTKEKSHIGIVMDNILKPSTDLEIYTSNIQFNYQKKAGPTTFSQSFTKGNIIVKYIYPVGTVFVKESTYKNFFKNWECKDVDIPATWEEWIYEGQTYRYPKTYVTVNKCANVYTDKVTLDEIKPANLKATIFFRDGEDYRTQFYDENGILQNKPIIFDGKINVDISFSLPAGACGASGGCVVYPKLPPGKKVQIEYTIKNSSATNYLLYRSGRVFDTTNQSWVTISNVFSNKLSFKNQGSDIVILAENDASFGETFLFTKLIDGCGFTPINISLNAGIPINSGYRGWFKLTLTKPGKTTPWNQYNYDLDFNNGFNQNYKITVPAFKSFNYKATFQLLHYEQQSQNQNALVTKVITLDPCSSPSGINLNISEGKDYYPDQVWLDVEGTVFCDLTKRESSAPKLYPSLTIQYTRDIKKNSNYSGYVVLNNGKVSTHVFRKFGKYEMGAYNNNGDYVKGAMLLNFDPGAGVQNITQKDGYFVGSLTYDAITKRFKLILDFDNQKIKFKYEGCALPK